MPTHSHCGIVDQNIKRAQLLGDVGDSCINRKRVDLVNSNGNGPSSLSFDLLAYSLRPLFPAIKRDSYISALDRQKRADS